MTFQIIFYSKPVSLHEFLKFLIIDFFLNKYECFIHCVALLFSCLPLLLGRSNEHFSHVVANNLETCPRPAKKYPQTVIKLDRMSGRNKKKCRALVVVRKQSRPWETGFLLKLCVTVAKHDFVVLSLHLRYSKLVGKYFRCKRVEGFTHLHQGCWLLSGLLSVVSHFQFTPK